jgi:hypothetical protein
VITGSQGAGSSAGDAAISPPVAEKESSTYSKSYHQQAGEAIRKEKYDSINVLVKGEIQIN